jgi:hypothetical protein
VVNKDLYSRSFYVTLFDLPPMRHAPKSHRLDFEPGAKPIEFFDADGLSKGNKTYLKLPIHVSLQGQYSNAATFWATVQFSPFLSIVPLVGLNMGGTAEFGWGPDGPRGTELDMMIWWFRNLPVGVPKKKSSILSSLFLY